jgi:hypothetical protein
MKEGRLRLNCGRKRKLESVVILATIHLPSMFADKSRRKISLAVEESGRARIVVNHGLRSRLLTPEFPPVVALTSKLLIP